MVICELISVGTELLLGEITNTNARFLSQQLAAVGIAVERQCTVGDNPARLRADFLAAWERSGIVILTGGLGPTADDITKEVVCEALGLGLEEDAFQMSRIEAFFKQRGIPMGESNRKQALVPKGCVVLPNENGTAPGCLIQMDGKCAALLPGPPREMQPLFLNELKPRLACYASGVIVSHHLRTVGIGESHMAELARDYLDLANPTVAPYAKDAESYLRVSAAASTEEEAEALIRPIVKKLKEILGFSAYSVDKPLEETIVDLLREAGKTVALAESCTGGGIAARLTDVPGASKVFGWGAVTYSNESKQALLGVSGQTLAKYGAVSPECAREMALGALARSGADFALAVTGVAGPGVEGTGKPAGLVYLAAADQNVVLARKLETGRNDRNYNRVAAEKQALALLRELILRP